MTISVLVTGSRDFEDRALVYAELERFCPDHVIVGCCPTGVDRLVREWCDNHGVMCEMFSANWLAYGKRAGPLRNRRMVRRAKELGAFVLAFPRGGPGTADCIRRAKEAELQVSER